MTDYVLPKELRPVLRDMHEYLGGTVLRGSPEEVAERVKEVLREQNIRRIWCVGDVVCQNFIKYGLKPYVCVIDGKTLRVGRVDTEGITEVFREVRRVRNPAGMITEEALTTLRSIKAPTLVVVDGEEDLLGLAAVLAADLGDLVVYGVPLNVGVAVIKVGEDVKERASRLLSMFTKT